MCVILCGCAVHAVCFDATATQNDNTHATAASFGFSAALCVHAARHVSRSSVLIVKLCVQAHMNATAYTQHSTHVFNRYRVAAVIVCAMCIWSVCAVQHVRVWCVAIVIQTDVTAWLILAAKPSNTWVHTAPNKHALTQQRKRDLFCFGMMPMTVIHGRISATHNICSEHTDELFVRQSKVRCLKL